MDHERAIQRLERQFHKEDRVRWEGVIKLLSATADGRAFLGNLLDRLGYGKPIFHENPYLLAGIAATASVGQELANEINRVNYSILPQIMKDRDDEQASRNLRRRSAERNDYLYGDGDGDADGDDDA